MKKFWVFLMIVGLLTVGGGIASADLLVDRGLPTSNLNNAAGSNRSNVAWADYELSNNPTEYWLPGDDFVLSGSGMYHIDTIRVWTTTADSGNFSLWAGSDTSTAGIFTDYTVTSIKYANDNTYQTSSGSFIDIYQLDFDINQDVTAGTYYFFLDGPWSARGEGYVNSYLHASNADLSLSPQDGADDYFQWLHIDGISTPVIESWLSTGGGTTGWGAGWDKNSDANIQVYGTLAPVPEPATMILLSSGLLGLVGIGRRKKFFKK